MRFAVTLQTFQGLIQDVCPLYHSAPLNIFLIVHTSFSAYDWASIAFSVLWVAFLLFIAYSFFESCLRNNANPRGPTAPPPPRGNSGGGAGGGWFPGDYRDEPGAPPPPYSYTKPTDNTSARPGWRPGFWTGAAVGGLANHMMNRRRNPPQPSYDWERPANPAPRPRPSLFGGGGFRRPASSDDRGEGSSNLGSMRRSTGLGGSSVR